MTKRGRVQRDTSVGDGVLAVDGQQYIFRLQGMWRSEMPPRMGMLVDVTFGPEGTPQSVAAVPESQIAREHAGQALAGVRQHGGEIAGSLKSRFGVPVLVAEAALLVGFFVIPTVSVTFLLEKSLSFWDLIGIDVNTMNTSDHGLLSLVAIVALCAPLAIPFVKQAWGRWLFAAPLGFVALACLTLFVQVERAASAVRQAAGGFGGEMGNQFLSMMHIGFGFFIVLASALYLASRSFKNGR